MKKHNNWEVRNPKTKKCKQRKCSRNLQKKVKNRRRKTFDQPLSKSEKSHNKETLRLENTEKT